MVKIIVVGTRGMPGVMGGVESHCEELYPRIKAIEPDIEIDVMARRPYVGGETRFHGGVRVVPVPSTRSEAVEALLSTFLALVKDAASGRGDILHIHGIGPALLTPLGRLLGYRIVVTHHGRDYERAKWGPLARTALRVGERLGVTFADAVIAVAPSLTEDLRSRFPRQRGRIVHIPNGAPAEPEPVDCDPLERFGLAPRGYLLAVGRLVPEKGFHLLVDAYRSAGLERKLVIAGGSDHETAYSRSLLASAGSDVVFTGRLPRSEVRKLAENADLFVLPSFHEGLPIVGLEALAAEVPILISDIAANRDLGLPPFNYFPAGDRDALIGKLRVPGASFAVDYASLRGPFDWNGIARQTLETYHGLMSRRPSTKARKRSVSKVAGQTQD